MGYLRKFIDVTLRDKEQGIWNR